jgi:DNA primase
LRSWLRQLGYPLPALQQDGLISATGYDTYIQRLIFPLEGNLYGRSLRCSASPHRFLPGSKGGLYLWEQVRRCSEVILVEGLFDYAVLWQAGFHKITCSLGNHLNAQQFEQLCDSKRTVYLVFDADANGSGPCASQSLSRRLWAQGIDVRRVVLPDAHDPNNFLYRAATHASFNVCWRQLVHEVPCH